MKSLVCVVVGDGSGFIVDIDEHKKVHQLKKMITEENRYPFASKDLKLYVAKKGGNWLKTSDPNVKQLQEGDAPAQIKDIVKENGEMDASYRIRNTAFGFPDEEDAEDGDIHILVDIPEYVKKGLRLLRDNRRVTRIAYGQWIAACIGMGLACYILFFTEESLAVQNGCLASVILALSTYAVTVLEDYWRARIEE